MLMRYFDGEDYRLRMHESVVDCQVDVGNSFRYVPAFRENHDIIR